VGRELEEWQKQTRLFIGVWPIGLAWQGLGLPASQAGAGPTKNRPQKRTPWMLIQGAPIAVP
jgi:hypothetical protein